MMRTIILAASLALFACCDEVFAAGFYNNASCSPPANTVAGELGADGVLFYCLTDVSESPVLDIKSAVVMTLFSTSAYVSIQICADPAGTKCEEFWRVTADTCDNSAPVPCNTFKFGRSWLKLESSAIEATGLIGIRGEK